MDCFGKPMERRKFLKKGISLGAMIVAFSSRKSIPLSALQPESISPRNHDSPEKHHARLVQVVRQYGGEFGTFKGGL